MLKIILKGPAACGKTFTANLIKTILEAQGKKVKVIDGDEKYKRQPYSNHPDILIKTKQEEQ